MTSTLQTAVSSHSPAVADLILVRRMSKRVTATMLLLLAVSCVAGEPDRAKGLSTHMLPDRVGERSVARGVVLPLVHRASPMQRSSLLTSTRSRPRRRRTAFWVVTTNPRHLYLLPSARRFALWSHGASSRSYSLHLPWLFSFPGVGSVQRCRLGGTRLPMHSDTPNQTVERTAACPYA